jgi:hypothetical protein
MFWLAGNLIPASNLVYYWSYPKQGWRQFDTCQHSITSLLNDLNVSDLPNLNHETSSSMGGDMILTGNSLKNFHRRSVFKRSLHLPDVTKHQS